MARIMWTSARTMGSVPPDIARSSVRLAALVLAEWGIFATCWIGIGAYTWWQFRRWGRVPRILTATPAGLKLSWLGWWRVRERHWPASEITAIEFWPVKGNLNWRRTVADLSITRRKGRRLHFRLSSREPELPEKIAIRIAGVLGVPSSRH